jgi:hypothetical protein
MTSAPLPILKALDQGQPFSLGRKVQSNSNIEYLNPKQIQMPQIQNPKQEDTNDS